MLNEFTTIARLLGALGLACASVTGCAQGPDVQEISATSEDAIIAGKASSKAQDAVVLLQQPKRGATCTGTLVAPNLVLTARHCVSVTDERALCSASGTAQAGAKIHGDVAPGDISVLVGRSRKQLKLAGHGKQILHDGARTLCNHDLAFLVLDRASTDLPVAKLRMHEPTEPGELTTAVGWGITEKADALPSTRRQRTGVAVLDVGPSADTASAELLVGEAACSGDSGGPLLAKSGAVIGVVSRGGNGAEAVARLSDTCDGPDAQNTYARVGAFPALVKRAFAAAHATPAVE